MNKHIISTLRFQYNIYLYFNAKKKNQEKKIIKNIYKLFFTHYPAKVLNHLLYYSVKNIFLFCFLFTSSHLCPPTTTYFIQNSHILNRWFIFQCFHSFLLFLRCVSVFKTLKRNTSHIHYTIHSFLK